MKYKAYATFDTGVAEKVFGETYEPTIFWITDSKGGAMSVLSLLCMEGLNADGETFPIKTWVKPFSFIDHVRLFFKQL